MALITSATTRDVERVRFERGTRTPLSRGIDCTSPLFARIPLHQTKGGRSNRNGDMRSAGPTGPLSGLLQLSDHGKHVVVRRDLPLLRANGIEANEAVAVDDEQGRTLAEAHHRAHHVVAVEYRVVAVGQQGKRVRVVAHESGDAVG